MKKWFAIILVFLILFSGCSSPQDTQSKDSGAEQQEARAVEPEEPAEEPQETGEATQENDLIESDGEILLIDADGFTQKLNSVSTSTYTFENHPDFPTIYATPDLAMQFMVQDDLVKTIGIYESDKEIFLQIVREVVSCLDTQNESETLLELIEEAILGFEDTNFRQAIEGQKLCFVYCIDSFDNHSVSIIPSSTDHAFALRELSYDPSSLTASAAADEEEAASSKEIYGEGQYKVGKDLPAGEYKAFVPAQQGDYGGLYELTNDANGDDIASSDYFYNFRFINVKDGQYLKLSNCYILPSDPTERITPEADVYVEGQYKIGVDIPAGEYELTGTSSEYGALCVLTSDANGDDIITSDYFHGNRYIAVEDGQYLQISECELHLN